MAMTEGIIIPKEISTAKILSDIKKLSEEQLSLQQRSAKIQDRIDKREAKGLEATETQINALYKLNDKYEETNSKLEDLVEGDPMFKAISKIFPERYTKQLQKTYTKYVIKGRYFAASLSVLEGIKEGILNSSWVKSLLGFLTFLTIFDKNGQFFKSLVKVGVNILKTVINFIIGLIPQLIKTVVDLLPELLSFVIKLIPEITKALANALINAGKKTGGFLGDILTGLGFIVQTITDILNYVIEKWDTISKIVGAILYPFLVMVKWILKFNNFLIKGWSWLFDNVPKLLSIISDFFTIDIKKGFAYLSKGWNTATESMGNFFTKGIPKFFDKYITQSFVKSGNWLLKISKNIWNWMKRAGKSIFDFFNRLTDVILHPFESLKSFITALGIYISSVLNKIFHPTEKALSWKQASAIGDISSVTGIDANRLANVVRGEGELELTKAERAALPSEFSQAQLQNYLNQLKGNEGSQLRALSNIEKAVMKLHQEQSGSNINATGEY